MAEQESKEKQREVSTLAAGDLFESSYRIEGLLGEGASSVVYRACHLSMHRDVALKILKQVSDERQLARFKQEARSLSLLDSPNILKVFATGISGGGSAYIVTELVDGIDLSRFLQEKNRLPPPLFCSMFKQLSNGLAAAHDSGIVHRDIKPENIMVSINDSGECIVKLVDFGLAKEFLDDSAQSLTATGSMPGSPAYMSPEQCQGKKADSKSDIYSLGIVMYQSICGRLPFQADSTMDLLYKQAREAAPRFADIMPSLAVPVRIESLIRKCIEKNPADRFQSSHELLTEIEAIETDPAAMNIAAQPVGTKSKTTMIAGLSIGCLLIVIAIIVVVVSSKTGANKSDPLLTTSQAQKTRPGLITLLAEKDKRKYEDFSLYGKQLGEALERYESIGNVDPLVLSDGYESLGELAEVKGDRKAAREFYLKSMRILEDSIGKNDLRYYGPVVVNYLRFLNQRDESLAEAEKLAIEAHDKLSHDKGRWDFAADSIRRLAEVRENQGRFEDALKLRQEVIDGCVKRTYVGARVIAAEYFSSATEYMIMGRTKQAKEFCDRYWKDIQDTQAADLVSGSLYLLNLLVQLGDSKQVAVVVDSIEEKIQSRDYKLHSRNKKSDQTRLKAARAYLAASRHNDEESDALCKEALLEVKDLPSAERIACLQMLGDVCAFSGKIEDALNVYTRLLARMDQAGIQPAKQMRVYMQMGALCQKGGREKQAIQFYELALKECPEWYKGHQRRQILQALETLKASH